MALWHEAVINDEKRFSVFKTERERERQLKQNQARGLGPDRNDFSSAAQVEKASFTENPSILHEGQPLRRVLRRVLESASDKVLTRVLRRCVALGFRGRKGSEEGSQKGF